MCLYLAGGESGGETATKGQKNMQERADMN